MTCKAIGDINRDGDVDSYCTATMSMFVKTEEGDMVDVVYEDSAIILSSEKIHSHMVEKSALCEYEETPTDTYYRYTNHKLFCDKSSENCFRTKNWVLDEDGFARRITGFEITAHFDATFRNMETGFQVVLGECELAEISALDKAPPLAKEHPLIWNTVVGVILLTNDPIKILSAIC